MGSLCNWLCGTRREHACHLLHASSSTPRVLSHSTRPLPLHAFSSIARACARIRVRRPRSALIPIRGQEEYERLRPMSYSRAHVVLIAFSVDTPDSLENVTQKVGRGRPRGVEPSSGSGPGPGMGTGPACGSAWGSAWELSWELGWKLGPSITLSRA
jgi:hypothetical protein